MNFYWKDIFFEFILTIFILKHLNSFKQVLLKEIMIVPPIKIIFSEEEIFSIQNKMKDVLQTGQLTMGKNVAEFEERFAEYIGTKYAIGTNTGFSALEIILRSLNVEDSTVIVPANTSMATPYSVLHAGGKVIFCDVSRDDLGMDINDLKNKIRRDTKAVIPVHMAGIISPRLPEIQQICEEHNLMLLEDAAHAHGAEFKGKKAGSLGDAGAFSFYATKVMTSGEGGMVTTNDDDIYKKALSIRNYGRSDPSINIHTEFGANFRLSEFHAIVGLEKLKNINAILEERKRIANLYDEKLKDIKQITPLCVPETTNSAFYKYVVYLHESLNRDNIKKQMKEKYDLKLPAEIYEESCPLQPFFRKYHGTMVNDPNDKFPEAEYICHQQICLPIYPGLKEEEIDYVVDSLEKVISNLN